MTETHSTSTPAEHLLIKQMLAAFRRLGQAKEADMRRMLGLWVSELEPELIYVAERGQPIAMWPKGLALKDGDGTIIIPARRIELKVVGGG